MTTDVVALQRQVDKMQGELAIVIWLHAELMYGLRLAAATQFIQQPQVQQALVDQIMSGAPA